MITNVYSILDYDFGQTYKGGNIRVLLVMKLNMLIQTMIYM